jgi:Plastocyanin
MNRFTRRVLLFAGTLGALSACSDPATTPSAIPTAIVMRYGDGQTQAANRPTFDNLVVVVTDQNGHGLAGQTVTWTIESGPVAFVTVRGVTDGLGVSTAVVRPGSVQGTGIVRAALAGRGMAVNFGLTVGPPVDLVVILSSIGTTPSFVSQLNHTSRPAVDTVLVGQTLKWVLPLSGYAFHTVISLGVPSFHAVRDIPFASPPTIRVTFTAPGTYRYTDSFNRTVYGIVHVQ